MRNGGEGKVVRDLELRVIRVVVGVAGAGLAAARLGVAREGHLEGPVALDALAVVERVVTELGGSQKEDQTSGSGSSSKWDNHDKPKPRWQKTASLSRFGLTMR